jgi:hypothetical protein
MKITPRDLGFALRDHFEEKTVSPLDEDGEILPNAFTQVDHIDISSASTPLVYLANGQLFKIVILAAKG